MLCLSNHCVHKSPGVLSECRSDSGLGSCCCYMLNKLPGDATGAGAAGPGTALWGCGKSTGPGWEPDSATWQLCDGAQIA